MILTGDPGQLPPVGDKPLYLAKPSNDVGEQGFQAYRMFEKVVRLCNGAAGTLVDFIFKNNHQTYLLR